ncbi:MAG: hypothetical protein ACK4IK_10225 [Bacteroidia bacterium]
MNIFNRFTHFIFIILVLYSCKKEDRDEIFKSKQHRYLTGVWEVSGIKINGIDSTSFLLGNDSICTRWIFNYIPEAERSYDFAYFNNGIDYSRGSWYLNEKFKNINISADKKLTPDNNKFNRWFESGFWEILEMGKNNMKLRFKNYNIEYEYSFYKYKDQ